jgi:hypothetical protein
MTKVKLLVGHLRQAAPYSQATAAGIVGVEIGHQFEPFENGM